MKKNVDLSNEITFYVLSKSNREKNVYWSMLRFFSWPGLSFTWNCFQSNVNVAVMGCVKKDTSYALSCEKAEAALLKAIRGHMQKESSLIRYRSCSLFIVSFFHYRFDYFLLFLLSGLGFTNSFYQLWILLVCSCYRKNPQAHYRDSLRTEQLRVWETRRKQKTNVFRFLLLFVFWLGFVLLCFVFCCWTFTC